MQPVVVIPARYDSTRFPGKPLALIDDKPMIQHTYEQAMKAGFPVAVATDDERIMNAIQGFGGEVVLTGKHCNGTSRCLEAGKIIEREKKWQFDVLINVQGDEPFIRPEQIVALADTFLSEGVDIATLCKRIEDTEELFNPNVVKVVRGKKNKALYFSRAAIPYCRDFLKDKWLEKSQYFKHIGMYAYRKSVLQELVSLEEGILEKVESLEQLRWLEAGYNIDVLETFYESVGIDTPEDLSRLKRKK